MSVSSTTSRVTYAGNGSTTAFSFPYYFLNDADLVVIVRNNTTGVETVKTLTTHYTVSGEGEDSGGTVTMLTAPASGETLIIYRDPAVTQDLDLVENDAFPAEEVEERLDKLTMISQRLSNLASRSVRLTDGFTPTFDCTLPTDIADSAGCALIINDDSDGLDIGPTADDIADAQANATAAAASATAAAASASAASTSATAAAASASAASTSATAAAASAASAASAATTAIANLGDGTVTAPVIAFASETGLGFFRAAADIIGLAKGALAFINPAASGRYNWLAAGQFNQNDTYEITPSSAVDGTTFSVPAFMVTRATAVITAVNGSSSGVLRFQNLAASGLYNWQIAAGFSTANSLEITPSTAADGSTYSTPLFKVTQAGVVAFGASGGSATHLSNGALTIIASAGPHLSIQDGGTAGSNADPYLRFMDGTPSDMGYVGFTVSNSLNMRVSNLKAGSLILAANGSDVLTVTSAGAVNISGIACVGGTASGTDTGFQIKNSALTGTTQYGVYVWPTGTSSATSRIYGIVSSPRTEAASFTVGNRVAYYADNPAAGAGSTITSDVVYGGVFPTRGTQNFFIADGVSAPTPIGTNDWFIYQSGTHASRFGGIVDFTAGLKTIVATANTANPPTNAELISAFGAVATVGTGFIGILNDNAGGANEYLVWCDGTKYWYLTGTAAP